MPKAKLLTLIAFAIATVPLTRAESIAITYSLTGTGTVVGGTATTLDLDAQAAGSILSSNAGLNGAWNPVSYSDESVLDFTTNLLKGTFTFTLGNGDTLTGNVFEDQTAPDTSPTQTGSFPQTLTFTGGTGEFIGASGSVSGVGFLGTTDFTVSGSGIVNAPAIPEPAPVALLVAGLALLTIGRKALGAAGSSRTSLKFSQRLNSQARKARCIAGGISPFLVAAVPFAILLGASTARADSLAYIASDGGAFGTLNLSTGVFSQIGSGLSDPGPGLVPLNGSLYILGFDGVLNAINPSTGFETPIGLGLGDCSMPGVSSCGPKSALAFGALSSTLYATDFANNLYTVNPSTGKPTLIGSTGMAPVTFVPALPNSNGTFPGVDETLFSAGGKLYANEDFVTIDPTSPNPVVGVPLADALYQINTVTGEATRIAPTLTPLNSFVNVNGTEYAFDGNLGEVLTVSLANGSTSVVNNYDPAAGLIIGASPVPEPASIALISVGITGAVVLGRARRKARPQRSTDRERTSAALTS